MPKSGQARVPTTEEWQRVFDVIQDHRHPEKNTAIMQISAKLGLRAQEIALLQIKEVARLKKSPPGFTLYKVMSLPAAYTKGANAMARSTPQYPAGTHGADSEGLGRHRESQFPQQPTLRHHGHYPQAEEVAESGSEGRGSQISQYNRHLR